MEDEVDEQIKTLSDLKHFDDCAKKYISVLCAIFNHERGAKAQASGVSSPLSDMRDFHNSQRS